MPPRGSAPSCVRCGAFGGLRPEQHPVPTTCRQCHRVADSGHGLRGTDKGPRCARPSLAARSSRSHCDRTEKGGGGLPPLRKPSLGCDPRCPIRRCSWSSRRISNRAPTLKGGITKLSCLGRTGFQLRGGRLDRAPWLDPPPAPKRAQLTGPPKSYRD